MTTTIMSNYSYGVDAYKELPDVLKKYDFKKIAFIGGENALASAEKEVRQVLEGTSYDILTSLVYGENSTLATIERLAADENVQKADVIFGFGGGRALDTTKMVAKTLAKPVFTFPTICSNCSAGTAIAVVYNEDHSVNSYGYPDAPLHIFINTRIIAEAPTKYFWAGIADGISKAPEVEHASDEALKKGQILSHTATLGRAIALSSKEAFYRYGEEAMKDVESSRASKAVEEIALDIIVSTGYASNLVNQPDFYYNSAHAHAFYNATMSIPRQGEYLHGVVVSFGVLVLHAYYDEMDELTQVAEFNRKLGLPVTLEDLGLEEKDVPKIVEVAMTTNEYKNTPFDPEKYKQAILIADQLGRK